MSEVERKILRQFAVDLKRDVIPSDVLCHLFCLSEDDCEQIQREEDRKGPRAAVSMLLDRLKKRLHQGAFKQFSTALGETGSPHLKELLENALREQTCQAEPDHNPTQDTASNLKSDVFKTPTKETTNPLSPSTPETKQSKKSTNSKKSNKKLKLKNGRVPKENTTSPSESKTHTKLKTSDPLVSQDTADPNPPYVKCVVKTPRDTKPKNQDVSQNCPRCPPVTRNNEDSQKEIPSSNSTETQPPANATEPDLPENSKTKYDTLVCYAKKNREVALELKQFLESEYGLQVCIDLEHFIPGKPTTDNISESINSSGSVIFLLSPEFLKKRWAPWELKHAVYDFIESQKDGTHKKIIPVLLEKCQVPDELKIYTAIEMEGSASRRDCWKKLAAAISGTSCSDDGDNSDGENGDGENGDGETNSDEDANNEGTIGVIDCNNGDDDDGVDKEGVEDTSDDENGDDSDDDLNQEGGEDTVNGSDEAESNDDDSTGSDNDHDGVDDGDEDDSENSTNDSDDCVNQNRDGNDTGADGNNSNEAGDSRCQDEVSDDVDDNGEVNNEVVDINGNNSSDAGDIVDSNHNRYQDEVSVDDNGDGNSGGVGTSNNVVAVDANAGGSVNNLGNRGDDVYGKIQSL